MRIQMEILFRDQNVDFNVAYAAVVVVIITFADAVELQK